MKFLCMLAAAMLWALPSGAAAGDISDDLEGTWIETVQFNNYPRTRLHFKGPNLRVENMFDKTISVSYAVSDDSPYGKNISFEYRHTVKRGNGRLVERRDAPEFVLHAENGIPVLSQTAIELDGRGLIIINEFLREKDFADGFESQLKHTLNDRAAPPMMMQP